MPIIPYRADVGSQQDTVASRPNVDSYTVGAKSFARLGDNVMETGDAIMKAQHAYDKEMQELRTHSAKSQARKDSELAIDDAMGDKTTNSQNLFSRASKAFEDRKTNFLKSMDGNDFDKAKLSADMDEIASQTYDKLLLYKMKMQEDELKTEHFKEQNKASAAARANPFGAEVEYENYKAMVDKSTMNETARSATLLAGRKQIADEAMAGFLDGKNYGEARKIINEKFADVYDAKDRAGALEHIFLKEQRDLDIQFKNEDNGTKRAVEAREAQQETKFQRYMKELEAQKEQNAPSDTATVLQNIQDDLTKQNIKPEQAAILESIAKNETVDEDPAVQRELWTRLVTRDNLQGLKQEVGNAAGNRQIMGTTAARIMQEIKKIEAVTPKDRFLSQNDKEVVTIVNSFKSQIQDSYAYQNGYHMNPQEETKLRDVTIQFWRNMDDRATYHGDPVAAGDAALAKYVKGKKLPKGFKFLQQQTLKEQGDTIRRLRGTIPPKLYVELLESLKVRSMEEDSLRSRKDNGVKSGK